MVGRNKEQCPNAAPSHALTLSGTAQVPNRPQQWRESFLLRGTHWAIKQGNLGQ